MSIIWRSSVSLFSPSGSAKQLARVLTVAALASGVASSAPSHAADSPSVRAAARLKNKPPRNWIRHYLGDDRYKIAGGTWKYVSTELDRFYYPAWAPEMLRQSPSRVIGFSSAQDAEEAGYLPGAGYAQVSPAFDPVHAGATSAVSTQNRAAPRAQRIVLADGVSSLVLPAGWKIMAQQQESKNGITSAMQIFQSPSGKRQVLVGAVTLPAQAGMSVEQILDPRIWNRGMGSSSISNVLDSRTANAMRSVRTERVTVGGMRGVRMKAPSTLQRGKTESMMLVGRRNKLFILADTGASGVGPILSSLRLR